MIGSFTGRPSSTPIRRWRRQAVRPQHANHRGRPAEGPGWWPFFRQARDRGQPHPHRPRHRILRDTGAAPIRGPPGGREHRSQPHQDEKTRRKPALASASTRPRSTASTGRPPQAHLQDDGHPAGQPELGRTTLKMVLRQDADADLLDTLPIAREKLLEALLLQITRSGAAVTLEVIPSA
jgi:hypothetical protein